MSIDVKSVESELAQCYEDTYYWNFHMHVSPGMSKSYMDKHKAQIAKIQVRIVYLEAALREHARKDVEKLYKN